MSRHLRHRSAALRARPSRRCSCACRYRLRRALQQPALQRGVRAQTGRAPANRVDAADPHANVKKTRCGDKVFELLLCRCLAGSEEACSDVFAHEAGEGFSHRGVVEAGGATSLEPDGRDDRARGASPAARAPCPERTASLAGRARRRSFPRVMEARRLPLEPFDRSAVGAGSDRATPIMPGLRSTPVAPHPRDVHALRSEQRDDTGAAREIKHALTRDEPSVIDQQRRPRTQDMPRDDALVARGRPPSPCAHRPFVVIAGPAEIARDLRRRARSALSVGGRRCRML